MTNYKTSINKNFRISEEKIRELLKKYFGYEKRNVPLWIFIVVLFEIMVMAPLGALCFRQSSLYAFSWIAINLGSIKNWTLGDL